MTRKVITVEPDDGIFKAQELMAANKIRHLPVIESDGRLIGIVTDRDIRSALPYKFFKEAPSEEEKKNFAELKIKNIMTQNPITISPTYTLQDALLVIQDARVGALPVVDENGILSGIISVRDLLRAFINVKQIVDAITEENISFGSVLVARYWQKDKRAVFPYLLTQNVAHVKEKLIKMGFSVLDPMEWYLDQSPDNE
jgi:acetoin utilization protein AcuB